MPRFHKKEIKRARGIVALLGALMFSFISCTTPNNPDQLVTDVIAVNSCGAAVDVFMDGTFQFSIENNYHQTIYGVSQGSHLFEAKKKGTEILVSSATLTISPYQTYEYDIIGPCAVTVTNEFGETLQIFSDETYQFDLYDNSSIAIAQVAFGVHSLSAAKKSDSAVVATTSIDFQEIKEYKWIITK
jgi:hypothetical protein